MILYHYCSNAALVSIISNKEIWASELSLSNDVLEGQWIREIFSGCCKDRGVSASTEQQLLVHLDFVIKMSAYAGFCMSEEGDLLSQWRAYADNGAGVSIGFNSQYFEQLGTLRRDRGDGFSAHLTKVEYNIGEQKKLIAEHLDRILELVEDGALRKPTLISSEEDKKNWQEKNTTMSMSFIIFYFFLFRLKNPAFSEEREWRIISHAFKFRGENRFHDLGKMDFRPQSDRIIPFARIALEALTSASIVEVVLGPKNATPNLFVEAMLHKYGWPNISVRRSTASYR